MAAKLEQNFRAAIGEDRTLMFTVLNAAGSAVDLTPVGTSVEWRMRTHSLSSVNVLQISGTNLGSDGTFDAVFTDVLTDSIEPRVYHHSAKVTDAAGLETVVALGSGDFYKTTT